ncbi:MAG: type II/IV secretion system protein [Candidatus Wallbacteria bacterium]|nr:type II/IV secretion system protein [Candidatus Wallbacteria bacterium]
MARRDSGVNIPNVLEEGGTSDQALDVAAAVLGGLAFSQLVAGGLPDWMGPLARLSAQPVFADHAALVFLAAVAALGSRIWLRREILRAELAGVQTLHRPDYEQLDPEDPMVKRLIKDRIEEKSSFGEPDVIDIVDEVLSTAVFLGASDVHLEAKAKQMRVSYRVDGILTDIAVIPKEIHQALVNRLKIMSQLDISKTDVPQDGRVSSRIRGRNHNMRISVFPTLHGETIVIRILGSAKKIYQLDDFGIQADVLESFKRVLHAPQGIILFTGPTGSGKTSVMYAALREILSAEHAKRNICTLEDPIEQDLDDINQAQIDPKKGVTFAVGLRAILRQDPDIIMVGEIRDAETAQVALQAGQTGHMIISTVHANSAAGAFARLIDMGLEPFLLASSVSGVVAQRLVRRLCPACRTEATPKAELLKGLGSQVPGGLRFYEGKGCEGCNGTGFRGRLAIFEFMKVNETISKSMMGKATSQELLQVARQEGMLTLLEDGLIKVAQGLTSLEELVRVVVG